MKHSHPIALDAPVGRRAVATFMHQLDAALSGDGRALMPLPAAGSPIRKAIESAEIRDALLPEIALVVPTSGSTGRPKLAMLSSTALHTSATMTHEALGGGGRWLLALPTTHIAGLQVLTRSVVSGFPPVVMDLTDGFRVRDLVDATQTLLSDIGPEPRYTSLVPTQLRRVLDAGGAGVAALVAMDAVLLGGASAPPELVARAHESGITLVQTYGMTETCGGCVYDGVPLPGVTVSIDASSRIRIESPTLFSGYYHDPEGTEAALVDGCFVTDDLGEFDAQGRLHVLGRIDDVIVSGGVNVSRAKVERAICEQPQVRDAVVFGQPDEQWGHVVVAVVLADGDLSLDAIGKALRTRLENHEMPKRFVVQQQLPYLASGKPDRQAIQELAFD